MRSVALFSGADLVSHLAIPDHATRDQVHRIVTSACVLASTRGLTAHLTDELGTVQVWTVLVPGRGTVLITGHREDVDSPEAVTIAEVAHAGA